MRGVAAEAASTPSFGLVVPPLALRAADVPRSSPWFKSGGPPRLVKTHGVGDAPSFGDAFAASKTSTRVLATREAATLAARLPSPLSDSRAALFRSVDASLLGDVFAAPDGVPRAWAASKASALVLAKP